MRISVGADANTHAQGTLVLALRPEHLLSQATFLRLMRSCPELCSVW